MSGDHVQLDIAVLMGERKTGVLDVSLRDSADISFVAGGELPFTDRSVRCVYLGDAATSLSIRDKIQLLIECRRVLRSGGQVLCAEPAAARLYESTARWAEFVGLFALGAQYAGHGWWKQPAVENTSAPVSILMPSFSPRFFAEALDSALAQTWQDIEIVICDDCETDEIERIAASRKGRVEIRYHRNPERLRARKNYQKCLSLARGDYVKFLNDDDLLEAGCVATMLGAFREVPDLVLATSHRWRIDGQSQVIDDMPATRPVVAQDLLIDGITLANAVIMYGLNFIGEPSTAMFRRRSFDPRPHVDSDIPFHFNGEEIRGAIDLAMWSRLLVQGNAVFFSDRLSRFRSHDDQAQARPDVVARSIKGIRGLQKQWIELGLFRRFPPHLLRAQPFSSGVNERNNWTLAPVSLFPPTEERPDEALQRWRRVAKHPFDTF